MIDLRSDTVTKPTPEMRQAMANAEVGDDVYGEDPTVNRLEQRAAEILGKEAGLFVPTGTMGNTIALKVHTEHGQEVICDARSHVLNFELSMMAWFTGCTARPVNADNGILSWDCIRPHLRALSPHWSPTGCISIENTHNMAGGTVYTLETLDEVYNNAQFMGLPVHMDGARIFNAATSLGVDVSRIAVNADTVMFCLSKGLGAPVGSMVVGSRAAIEKGRLYRKRLGGGMRQAGILAAAGLIALERMPQRLEVDHRLARKIAERLTEIPGISLKVDQVQSNIVIFDVSDTGFDNHSFVSHLKSRGVLVNAVGSNSIRVVTHLDVTEEMCMDAVKAVREVASATQVAAG